MARGLVLALALIVYVASPLFADDGSGLVTPSSKIPPKPRPLSEDEMKSDEAISKRMEVLKKRYEDAQENKIDGGDREPRVTPAKPRDQKCLRVSPEQEQYYWHIRDIITSNWIVPEKSLSDDWRCLVRIVIEPDGSISNMLLTQESGFPDIDEGIIQAVKKSSPLPPLSPAFEDQPLAVVLNFNSNHNSKPAHNGAKITPTATMRN